MKKIQQIIQNVYQCQKNDLIDIKINVFRVQDYIKIMHFEVSETIIKILSFF